jgi:ornithine cyclodeaminase/alanine dehydrogenase-like protein (mu-crystallin family)
LNSLIANLRRRHHTHSSDKRKDGGSHEVEFRGVDGSILNHDSRSALLCDADIICTATSSRSPLFTSNDIPTTNKRHTHINLVGSYTPSMHEVDSALIRRSALVVVDSRVACLGSGSGSGEAGELLKAGMNGEDVIELGELVLRGGGEGKGDSSYKYKEYKVEDVLPTGDHTLTVFKSVGVGVQDVAIAELVVRRAEEMSGIGVLIAEYDRHDVQVRDF